MTVRAKIALTILFTGLLTALGVVLALVLAYERFEHESSYYRADAFLKRVTEQHSDLLGMRERFGEDFDSFLGNLVLYEPDTQLYLLDPQGQVLSSTSQRPLAADFRVSMGPVMLASGKEPMPYVLGDNPERMDARVVVAARALKPMSIAPDPPVAGYLYLVSRPRGFTEGRSAALNSALSQPFVLMMLAVVALSTLLAAWITANVTRPLKRLTTSVSRIRDEGLEDRVPLAANDADAPWNLPDARDQHNEFGQLARGIGAMLQTLRQQWAELRRLDHFRREGVSNLSHDLRSPLTATSACLETLANRWQGNPAHDADRELVAVALRNTHNAARLVQSMGDLARLDEPAFELKTDMLDLGELLDDVAIRFAERARQLGVTLSTGDLPGQPHSAAMARVDVQLIERAVANLIDNALKYGGAGDAIELRATRSESPAGPQAVVTVSDHGPGIAAVDLPHLFDRFYQSRSHVAPATGEGGKGLGLAIVKRIAELHGGQLSVASTPGAGTVVTLALPAA
jgi:signal transduction histidine kinase